MLSRVKRSHWLPDRASFNSYLQRFASVRTNADDADDLYLRSRLAAENIANRPGKEGTVSEKLTELQARSRAVPNGQDDIPGKELWVTRSPTLPLFPASWYLFAYSQEVTFRPIVRHMLGRDLVAFRGQSGRAVLMDARCSHFGADLGGGRVKGDSIQCPYHGWKYGPDGRCEEIPSGCAIPPFARQPAYPVEERHGYLFFFNGQIPAFPLPWFLDGELAADYVASRPFRFTATAPWPSVTGHAFDIQHFLHVHDRRLLEPPTIDVPSAHARRIRYRAEIVPRNWRDKALSMTVGREVTASLVVWGGTFAMISAYFGRAVSRFMMTMLPINRQETLCQGMVFAPKSWKWGLGIRRLFTRAYLEEENRTLRGALTMPHRFVESDRPLRDYFDFLEETQRAEGELL
jgi:phenylpropionate dioxygenase-like ring-hydroxylating dioxygenase large terminal subunit